jgi:hypothetical protein
MRTASTAWPSMTSRVRAISSSQKRAPFLNEPPYLSVRLL